MPSVGHRYISISNGSNSSSGVDSGTRSFRTIRTMMLSITAAIHLHSCLTSVSIFCYLAILAHNCIYFVLFIVLLLLVGFFCNWFY